MEILIGLIAGLVLAGTGCWFLQEFRWKSKAQENISSERETSAQLRGQLEQSQNAQDILKTAKEQLSETFQAAASRAMQSSSETLLTIAQENLGKTMEEAKGEIAQRHEQFQALVQPLAENYGKLNPQIESLTQTGQNIISETAKLSNALTSNTQVGAWGEIQLRRVIEMAGMIEHCDFFEQKTTDGSLDRPDVTIRLPENRTIIVDAKASTAALLEAAESETEQGHTLAMAKHAQALRNQVDSLSKKDYGSKIEGSMDFVVMFVPGDQFLNAALSANPHLVEYAIAKRVAITTPTTLIPMLWAVANGWQRYQIAEQADEIRKVGEEMHRRMLTFINHYETHGKRLASALDSYNSSVQSFDSRVVPQGRRFAQMVTGDEDAFTQPSLVEKITSSSRYAQDELQEPDSQEAASE